MGMLVRRISVGVWGIWVETGKMWGIRVTMQGVKVEA